MDVAALFAAAISPQPGERGDSVDDRMHDVRLDPGDTISLAERLAKFGGGGTNCSLPLTKANRELRDRKFAGCILATRYGKLDRPRSPRLNDCDS